MDTLPSRGSDAPRDGGSDFGTLLRALRLDRGLTQEELADRAGMSVRAVGSLERGHAIPRRDTAERLCAALGLDDEPRGRLVGVARTRWGTRQRTVMPGGLASEAAAGPTLPAPPASPSVPVAAVSQLPWDVPGLVGRDEEISRLLDAGARDCPGIWVIDGLGGVGKTALAVHVGHLLADRFPDGQFYLDLRGFDVRQPPVLPSAALSHFLHALGVDERRQPTAEDELGALFRSTLSGKGALVVLDNAASAEQARALLPGTAGCLVLITSRNLLSGLTARDGASRITLRSLDPGSATALLARIIGPELARRGPDAPGDLARLCGFLPLALRIAAERARMEGTSIASLMAGLAGERGRLDLLTTDDESTSVRAVFSWSYRGLEPRVAGFFRLLALHPGSHFTVQGAAVLAGTSDQEARHLMNRLVSAHLIERYAPDRFHFHDLMRDYAAERATADEPQAKLRASIRRLVHWYLAAAVAADRQISPHRYRAGLDDCATDHELPPLASYREAVDWCDAELDTLVATVRLASTWGEHGLAWRLAWAMVGYLDLRRPWDAWLTTHQIGLQAARKAGDALGEAAILTSLGLAYYYPRLFTEAEDCYQEAQRLWAQLGDRRGGANIINAIANIRLEMRRLDEAVELYEQALALSAVIGDRRCEGVVLSNLAEAYCELGRFAEVLQYAPAAIEAARDTRNQRAEVLSLCQLARAISATRGIAEADGHFSRAIELARAADDRHAEAWTLDYLGTALMQARRCMEALVAWQGALARFEELRDPQAVSVRARLSALQMPTLGRDPCRAASRAEQEAG